MEYILHCGCQINVSEDTISAHIDYCPKHKAADAMYKALKKIFVHWKLSPHLQEVIDGYDEDYLNMAEKALAKAEGK